MFQEPKVEFIPVDEMVKTDDSTQGQETHMCSGTGYQPGDACGTDPSMF